MKVATRPCRTAMVRAMKRRLAHWSAIVSGSATLKSISCWPGATSWWEASTPSFICSSAAPAPGRPPVPGEAAERCEIGHEQGIRFPHAGEALERRAVERPLASQGPPELGGRDLHGLIDAQQVGELKQQEPHTPLLQLVDDFSGVGGGGGHGDLR